MENPTLTCGNKRAEQFSVPIAASNFFVLPNSAPVILSVDGG